MYMHVDAAPLCAFRALFGALMVVHAFRLHAHGMYERSVINPAFHFRYRFNGHELMLPLPETESGARLHLLLLGIAAAGVMLGIATRYCALTFALAHVAFVLSDRTIFNNHYYLYELFATLIAIVRADSVYSLPSWHRGAPESSPSIPIWQRSLLRLQVGIVYAYAGLAKLNSDWLLHSQPMATKLPEEATQYNPYLKPLLVLPETARVVSLCGGAFDVLIVPMLLSRSTRPLALLLTSAFHLSNHCLWQLGDFPWVMLATNLLFLDALPPGWRRGSWRRGSAAAAAADAPVPDAASAASAASAAPATATTASGPPLGWRGIISTFGLACYCALQLLLPLRPYLVHGLDPLDAVHTKTHTLLSWRMMAVSTRNFVNVSLRSDTLGASMHMTRTYNRLHVSYANGTQRPLSNELLQPRQAGYMPYSPHMLLSFARDAAERHGCSGAIQGIGGSSREGSHAAMRAAARGGSAGRACEVRGDLWSAINGRPLQRFVDPSVDLATASVDELRRPSWVLPLLHEYGNSTWRRRMQWMRTRLAPSGHAAAFFADVAGGVFNETFPAAHPFPARALIVPLHGLIAVDIYSTSGGGGGGGSSGSRGRKQPPSTVFTSLLTPPNWDDSKEHELMEPSSAPLEVPFGRAHAVRTLDGAGGSGTSACWAYVFGTTPEEKVHPTPP